jgi:hypothetical protein
MGRVSGRDRSGTRSVRQLCQASGNRAYVIIHKSVNRSGVTSPPCLTQSGRSDQCAGAAHPGLELFQADPSGFNEYGQP